MIEALKDVNLIKKVGGKFKLSTLIQKRMLELMQGSRPLIDDVKGMTRMEIAVQEIVDDKIVLEDAPLAPERPTF